jgi:hypothetical protein
MKPRAPRVHGPLCRRASPEQPGVIEDRSQAVLSCDRQSDHEVDCDVVISNIHDQVDEDIFGPNYRQKCWTTVVVRT